MVDRWTDGNFNQILMCAYRGLWDVRIDELMDSWMEIVHRTRVCICVYGR